MIADFIGSRIIVREAAQSLDNEDEDARLMATVAKLLTPDRCSHIVDFCLQVHGGYGYLSDYGIERVARDLRVHSILEGSNEIMRLILARETFPASK
jgi:alkylation response protein AidB-like acyl-CoA dehydrogenase